MRQGVSLKWVVPHQSWHVGLLQPGGEPAAPEVLSAYGDESSTEIRRGNAAVEVYRTASFQVLGTPLEVDALNVRSLTSRGPTFIHSITFALTEAGNRTTAPADPRPTVVVLVSPTVSLKKGSAPYNWRDAELINQTRSP